MQRTLAAPAGKPVNLPPFTALDWATWSAEMAAQAAVLVTALRLPRPRPHVPLFVFVLLSEMYMRGVEALYLEGVAVPGVPPVGAARALYHSVQALHTAWPAAVAALAWWVYKNRNGAMGDLDAASVVRSPTLRSATQPSRVNHVRAGLIQLAHLPAPVKAIFCLWLAFNAAMVAAHPLPRGWTQPALHAFAGACVLAGVVAIVTGWARRYGRAAQIAGYLVVVEGVVALVGPWAGDVFRQWRTVGAGMYGVAFTLLAGWQWARSKATVAP